MQKYTDKKVCPHESMYPYRLKRTASHNMIRYTLQMIILIFLLFLAHKKCKKE